MSCADRVENAILFRECSGQATVRAECVPGEITTGGSAVAEGSKPGPSGSTTTTRILWDRPDPATEETPTAWVALAEATYGYGGPVGSPPPEAETDPVIVYAVCAS